MSAKSHAVLLAGTVIALASAAALADEDPRFPPNPTFTTLATTPFAIEGLTGDAVGNLYTTGRQPNTAKNCPVWRIAPNGTRTSVAFIPNSPACNPSGITFDASGFLYVADSAGAGTVWKVLPSAIGCNSDDSALCPGSPLATAFATSGCEPSVLLAARAEVMVPGGSERLSRPTLATPPLATVFGITLAIAWMRNTSSQPVKPGSHAPPTLAMRQTRPCPVVPSPVQRKP
jgi:hypothetical protein